MLATVAVQAVVAMLGVTFGVVCGLAALAAVFAVAERLAPRRGRAA